MVEAHQLPMSTRPRVVSTKEVDNAGHRPVAVDLPPTGPMRLTLTGQAASMLGSRRHENVTIAIRQPPREDLDG